jgi:hypothetical protein
MAAGYNAVPGELRAHGSHLDGLVDRLGMAVDAARIASMPGDSYGLLCAFLPPIISPVEEKAADALAAAVAGVTAAADGIRTTATTYDDQETANAEPFARMRTDSLGGS